VCKFAVQKVNMPKKLTEEVETALAGKDYESLDKIFAGAPLLSEKNQDDFIAAMTFLKEGVQVKGGTTVEAVLPIVFSAMDRPLQKFRGLAKFIALHGEWLAVAAMSVGVHDSLIDNRLKELVECIKQAKNDDVAAPYVRALSVCVTQASDILTLCAPIAERLLDLVKRAGKQPAVVNQCGIDAAHILVGLVDENSLGKKSSELIFGYIRNTHSFIYAPLRQKHVNASTLSDAAGTILSILRAVTERYAEASSIFTFDPATMCIELPTNKEPGIKDTSVAGGGKKKKASSANMTPAAFQKLLAQKKAKGGSVGKKVAGKAGTAKSQKSAVAIKSGKIPPAAVTSIAKNETFQRIGKEDHPLIASAITFLLEGDSTTVSSARSTIKCICTKKHDFQMFEFFVSAFRRNLCRQGRAMGNNLKKSERMKENFAALCFLGSCFKVFVGDYSDHKVVGNLMICAHHPVVTLNPEKAYSRWCEVKSLFVDKEIFVPELDVESVKSNKYGLFSPIHSERAACIRLLGSVAEHFHGNPIFLAAQDNVIPFILEQLKMTDAVLKSLSPKQVGIFNTPKGQLYSASRAAASPEDDHAKQFHGTADERWEQEVRMEMERKKAKELAEKNAKAGIIDPKIAAIMKEEESIRQNISVDVCNVVIGMDAITAICIANDEFIQPQFSETLRTLNSLYNHQKIEDVFNGAKKAMAALCSCAKFPGHKELAQSSSDLYRRSTRQENLPKDLETAFVDAIYDYCIASTQHGIVLTSETCSLVLTVMNHVARTSVVSGAKSKALLILKRHCSEGMTDILRAMSMETTLLLLKDSQGMTPSPADVLTILCKGGSEFTSRELEIILGVAGTLSPYAHVRRGTLEAITELNDNVKISKNYKFILSLWLLQFDPDSDNLAFAEDEWTRLFGENDEDVLPKSGYEFFLDLMCHEQRLVQNMAADALAGALGVHTELVPDILQKILQLYESNAPSAHDAEADVKESKPKFAGAFRKMKEVDPLAIVRAGTRAAIGRVFGAAGDEEVFTEMDIVNAFSFLIKTGLRDKDPTVRQAMMDSGLRLVTQYGKESTDRFLEIFESSLREAEMAEKQQDLTEADYMIYDHQRKGIIVFMGTIAKHMRPDNPKIPSILAALLSALRTNSEDVQLAVAGCLPALMKLEKKRDGNDGGKSIVEGLLGRVMNDETYGERRGAAHGLAAVVKGLGVPALTTFDIIGRLKSAAANRKEANHRQGALFCFESFCVTLGLLFEPFVIQLLESMLILVSDRNPEVSDAAKDATRAVMAKLSAHGVKLVMGPLLNAFEAPKWQSKVASINMLGSMAYCAPKQLASCLPKIMPKLTLSLADAHPKVRREGLAALGDITSVITNPEVSTVAKELKNAMEDPPANSEKTLLLLQDMDFVNPVDAPALAMIMPVVLRGMSDRSTKCKSAAAKIIGGMSSMVNEPKTLMPYKEEIESSLRKTLVDPLPNVRAVAARSLGELVRGLGESEFPGLVDWLIVTMKSETTTVERSGGAQGLSEVLVALGPEKLESTLLSQLLPLQNSGDAWIREGMMWVLAFLPPVMGFHFADILELCLPVVLKSLSDEAEFVRNVSLKAGQIIVTQHAVSHTDLLLPVIEGAMFDSDWRIRQSAVQLLGDLLFKLAGIRRQGVDKFGNANEEIGKAGIVEEDEGSGESSGDDEGIVEVDTDAHVGSLQAEKSLIKGLGEERHNGIIAALFIVRADHSIVVRQAAIQVWKMVVYNTGRTMRLILPALMDYIIRFLSSEEEDKRYTAGTALGDVVRKLGDRVLPTMVPILKDGLSAEDEGQRQGVCRGLVELIAAAGKRNLQTYAADLVACVKTALCDPSQEVREAAALSFESLQKQVGQEVTTAIFPSLLRMLEAGDEMALNGIKEVLAQKSTDLLPYLIPKLTSPVPLGIFQAKAIAGVADVSGSVLHNHVGVLLPVLLETIVALEEVNEDTSAFFDAAKMIVVSVEDVGVQWTLVEIGKQMSHSSPAWRRAAFWLLEQYVSNTNTDFTDWMVLILKVTLSGFFDSDQSVLQAANKCLGAINKAVDVQILLGHLDFMRQHVGSMVSGLKYSHGEIKNEVHVPGYNIPKGLANVVPVYLHALMYGSTSQRESAADGIGELVTWCTADALKSFYVKLTGPLIRVVGDRFTSSVKAAILKTLMLLLNKAGTKLRAFLPQLQTTFLKNISDSSHTVRKLSVEAFAALLPMVTRVEPLVSELLNGLVNADLTGVKESYAAALAHTIIAKKGDIPGAAIEGVKKFLHNNENEDVQRVIENALSM
jgi:hypothetical protein